MSIDVSHAMCAVCIDILPCFSWQILKIFASESRIPAFHRMRLPWAWEPAGGEIAPKPQVRSVDWGPQSTGGVKSSYVGSYMFIMSIDVSHAMCAVCIDILPCFSWQILKKMLQKAHLPQDEAALA